MPSGISIVIVSYHVRDLLRACLASVFAQEIPGTEVIVIDNASSDGTLEMIREEFPQVRLIANEKNAGFSAANNQGIGKYRVDCFGRELRRRWIGEDDAQSNLRRVVT